MLQQAILPENEAEAYSLLIDLYKTEPYLVGRIRNSFTIIAHLLDKISMDGNMKSLDMFHKAYFGTSNVVRHNDNLNFLRINPDVNYYHYNHHALR